MHSGEFARTNLMYGRMATRQQRGKPELNADWRNTFFKCALR